MHGGKMEKNFNPVPYVLDQNISPGTSDEVRTLYHSIPQIAQSKTYGDEEPVVLLDLETTGINPDSGDKITEIACIKMQGTKIIEVYQSLVNPERIISDFICELTGITNEMVADAPTIKELEPALQSFIGECDIVAHNASFDKKFLESETSIRNNWVDTIRLLRIGMPRLQSYAMGSIGAWLGSPELKDAHRALSDTRVLVRVWRAALAALSTMDPWVLSTILSLDVSYSLDENKWIKKVLDDRGDKFASFDLKSFRQEMLSEEPKYDERFDAYELNLSYKNKEKLKTVFDLMGDEIEGYEKRDSQIQMANEVYNSFSENEILCIEAPTGVGKSLAYLLPALLHAQENNITVGVATKTNTLSDQLITNELPRLSALLQKINPTKAPLRYEVLKGYENYFCLRKVGSHMRRKTVMSSFEYALSWISQTKWGDASSVQRIDTIMEPFIATSTECLKVTCPHFRQCYIHGARNRAKSADLVVTNHSLLLRDSFSPFKILPKIRYWIVDEAHSFEKETRSQSSTSFSAGLLLTEIETSKKSRGTVKRLNDLLRTDMPLLAVQSESAQLLGLFVEELTKIESEIKAWQELFEDFLKENAPKPRERGNPRASALENQLRQAMWFNSNMRESASWLKLKSDSEKLLFACQDAHAKGEALEAALVLEEDDQLRALVPALRRLLETIDSSAKAFNTIIFEVPDSFVYSIGSNFRTGFYLNAQVIDAGEILQESLYPSVSSLVYCSATLSIESSFDDFKRRVGLDGREAERTFELVLPDVFDLENQMTIYVPSDLPAPNEARYIEELSRHIEEVHQVSGGGILALFTSIRDMRNAASLTREYFDRNEAELLVQGLGAGNLVNSVNFVDSRDATLFATKSFWEGFDAQGETLRCVVIAKIPFTPPNDPLSSERRAREGARAWSKYDLPDAILEIRQAVGRLIRSKQDNGHVILADSRILQKGYGKRIINSLPVELKGLSRSEIIADMKKDYNSPRFEFE